MGASVPFVVGIAALQDVYDVKKASKMLGVIGATMQIVPTMAPVLGGYIDVYFGWRMSFALISFLSALVFVLIDRFFTETLTKKKREPVPITYELKEYIDILKHSRYLCMAIIYPLLVCGIWGYLTIAPFYFIDKMYMAPNIFGFMLASMTISYALSSLLTVWVLEKMSP